LLRSDMDRRAPVVDKQISYGGSIIEDKETDLLQLKNEVD